MRSVRLGTLAAVAVVFAAGCDTARTLEQRSEAEACARCHGFPPPAPHPQLASCSACHGTTVVEGTTLVEGGTHANGRVEVTAHPLPYLAQHSREALARPDQPLGQPLLSACTPCHGGDFAGGFVGVSCNACHASLTPIAFPDWQSNCTFCHGTRTAGATGATPLAAPPQTVLPEGDPGAHQPHLVGRIATNGVACTECHPNRVGLGHVNGAVELAFGPLATANGATATYEGAGGGCTNYCHGATIPEPPDFARAPVTWAPTSPPLTCDSCHQGNPTTGRHPAVSDGHGTVPCLACHGGTYELNRADRTLHVNGVNDKNPITGWDPAAFDGRGSCTAVCHPQGPRAWR